MSKKILKYQQNWRQKGLKEGRKFIGFMLSKKGTLRINELQAETGQSISKIIENLLGEPEKIPIDTVVDMDIISKIKSTPPPENEQLKNLIIQLKTDHDLTHQEIADYLAMKGIDTLSGHGQWQRGTISKLLKKWGIA